MIRDVFIIIYPEAKESIHLLNACILPNFHCSGVKFCMIYFYTQGTLMRYSKITD